MQRENVRVVLASEHPEVRHFLNRLIEQEGGVDIVGAARNASDALTLTRNLRPDVAVVDCYLPHTVGWDTIPLSRIGGLDTAQAIAEEIPNTRVILLDELNGEVLPKQGPGLGNAFFLSRRVTGQNIPFTLPELSGEALPSTALIFANIGAKQPVALQQKVTGISDKVIFFSALAFAGGWLLTLTMFLAPVGVPLALAGGAMLFLGLVSKLTASLWHKARSGRSRG